MSAHVMFVISGLERGGAENQLVAIANGLAGRGWRVTVLSYLPFSEDSLLSEIHESEVTVLTLNASDGIRRFASLISAASVIRRQRPDVLVGFMYHGMMTARLPRLLLGVRARVSSIHNERDSPVRERLLGLTDGMADAVTVLSSSLADELCRRGVTTASRVRVIPNFVDIDRFAPDGSRQETRRRVGHISNDRFLWLAAGRLAVQKGLPDDAECIRGVVLQAPGIVPGHRGRRPLTERSAVACAAPWAGGARRYAGTAA